MYIVHRWRKLEGSDPKRYELVQKVHTLQSRLIAKTEEVKSKSKVIIIVVYLFYYKRVSDGMFVF